jgi:hypothetical protein
VPLAGRGSRMAPGLGTQRQAKEIHMSVTTKKAADDTAIWPCAVARTACFNSSRPSLTTQSPASQRNGSSADPFSVA